MATIKKPKRKAPTEQRTRVRSDAKAKTEGTSGTRIPDAKLLRLQSIRFDHPPFRKLGSIRIEIAPRITLIAGRNGIGKSTVLALIAGSSGITRQSSLKTYLGGQPNVNSEEILRLSFERDFVKSEPEKAHVLLQYGYAGQSFLKKGNVTGSQDRLRVVPRNEPKGEAVIDGLTIPADGKVPLPTIYLGMMRVIPIGESDPESVLTSRIAMHDDDFRLYQDFTNRIIHPGSAEQDGSVTAQLIQGTKKNSLYPKYAGYDSTNVSLGQDSLSSIATALASFSKLRRAMGLQYRGGLLVIDELDAGFHPHAQVELFDELKSKARDLQIQVVATTHSLTMLEHAHQDIFNDRRKGEPPDQIVYLKAGNPVEVLDATEFDAIHADMHMKLRTLVQPARSVKVYVEDDEAALFLDAILDRTRRQEIQQKTGFRLDIISAHVGCSNLVHLIRADDYFKTVVVILDGDTDSVSAGGAQNVVRLPVDPQHGGKQSPEVIIKAMCQAMCTNATAYPKMRALLRSVGADTTYLEKYILQPQRGENVAMKPIEGDREVAKAWFKLRLAHVKSMKLIEGWVADNETGVAEFMTSLASAVLAASGRTSKTAQKTVLEKQKTA